MASDRHQQFHSGVQHAPTIFPMKHFFKKIFNRQTANPQSIGVVEYPDKIVIETYHQIKNSYWIRSSEVSVISPAAPNFEIGQAILRHLSLSKNGIKMPGDERRAEFKKKYAEVAGLKTLNSQMKDSRLVLISRENGKLQFMPNSNGGTSGENKGYSPLTNHQIEISDTEDHELIAQTLKEALKFCR